MRRFDPGSPSRRRSSASEIGELLALKAWYCDSAYRYTMTDALQPMPAARATAARRPAGNPKADRRRYCMLGHGSHLVDTARFLGGDIVRVARGWSRSAARPLLVRGGATSPTVPPATST